MLVAIVLVIMPAGVRRCQLVHGLTALGAQPLEAGCCREAEQILLRRDDLNLVISDADLGDGDWRQMLARTQEADFPAAFLVSTPFANDGLWSEALWRGAYDLLVDSYSMLELRRIVEGALRTSASHGNTLRALATTEAD